MPETKLLSRPETARSAPALFERAAALRFDADLPDFSMSGPTGLTGSAGSMKSSGSTTSTLTARPRTIEEKLDALYGVQQVGDEVRFAARFEGASKVLIAGDFNNWSPVSTPMASNDAPGMWITKLPLNPGRYRYRFVVDGRWLTDPHNVNVETNQFGELNNVVEVG